MGVPCIALGAAAFSLTALSVKLMSQKAHADGTRFVPVTETASIPSALCLLVNSIILMAMPATAGRGPQPVVKRHPWRTFWLTILRAVLGALSILSYYYSIAKLPLEGERESRLTTAARIQRAHASASALQAHNPSRSINAQRPPPGPSSPPGPQTSDPHPQLAAQTCSSLLLRCCSGRPSGS
jgi:hypothetical protein